jgi:hypothetical protein
MAEQLLEAGKAKNIQVCFGRSAANGALPGSRRQAPRRLFLSARDQADGEFSDSSLGGSEASSISSDDFVARDDEDGDDEAVSHADSDSASEVGRIDAPRPLPSAAPDAAAVDPAYEEEILSKMGKRVRKEYQRVKDGLPGNDKADFRDMRFVSTPFYKHLLFPVVLRCRTTPRLDLKVLALGSLPPSAVPSEAVHSLH